MVVAVPRERPPIGWKPRDRCFAEDRRFFRWRARQSEGTTSKPEAGQEQDRGLPRLRVARSQGFEDHGFTGDVEVVRLGAEAGLGHRAVRPREGPRAVEDDGHALDTWVGGGGLVEREDAMLEAKVLRHARDLAGVPAGEDRPLPARRGQSGDQVSRVAVRAIDEVAGLHIEIEPLRKSLFPRCDVDAHGPALAGERLRLVERRVHAGRVVEQQPAAAVALGHACGSPSARARYPRRPQHLHLLARDLRPAPRRCR